MRVIVVPMMAMAESSGPAHRSRALVSAMAARGWQATLCVPEGSPAAAPDGVDAQPVIVPSPLGMPRAIGKRVFPLAQRLGVNRHVPMSCFDGVLKLTGNVDANYLASAVEQLREIIQHGCFDAVYSEFNIAAIIAAMVEGVPVFGTTSYPTQPSFASDPSASKGVNRVLRSLSMEPVRSPEDILLEPRIRFVPSCHDLEPFPAENPVIFTGPFGGLPPYIPEAPRNAVVAYLGNGVVTPRRAYTVLAEALRDSGLDLYVAGLPEDHAGNLHAAPRFDFTELLSRAAVFVNHGGQNSVMDGIAHVTPQLICPGRIFERRFNAEAAKRCGVGITMEHDSFDAENVHRALEDLLENAAENRRAAETLRSRLSELGGAYRVIDSIEADMASL